MFSLILALSCFFAFWKSLTRVRFFRLASEMTYCIAICTWLFSFGWLVVVFLDGYFSEYISLPVGSWANYFVASLPGLSACWYYLALVVTRVPGWDGGNTIRRLAALALSVLIFLGIGTVLRKADLIRDPVHEVEILREEHKAMQTLILLKVLEIYATEYEGDCVKAEELYQWVDVLKDLVPAPTFRKFLDQLQLPTYEFKALKGPRQCYVLGVPRNYGQTGRKSFFISTLRGSKVRAIDLGMQKSVDSISYGYDWPGEWPEIANDCDAYLRVSQPFRASFSVSLTTGEHEIRDADTLCQKFFWHANSIHGRLERARDRMHERNELEKITNPAGDQRIQISELTDQIRMDIADAGLDMYDMVELARHAKEAGYDIGFLDVMLGECAVDYFSSQRREREFKKADYWRKR